MPVGSCLPLRDAEPGSLIYFAGNEGSGFGIVALWNNQITKFVGCISEHTVKYSGHDGLVYVIPDAFIEPVISSFSVNLRAPAGALICNGDSAALVCCLGEGGEKYQIDIRTGVSVSEDFCRKGFFTTWYIVTTTLQSELVRVQVS
ncbi:hypothetical protein [Methylocystis sp.]|uniref:hypothetical protein n=1 Tax=Methylocystis sp. TaxID=1911079 RepID=UPI003DA2A83B